MKKVFTIEDWLKASFAVLKVNWLLWIIISAVTTAVISSLIYLSYRDLSPRILELIQNQGSSNLEESAIEIAKMAGMYILGIFLFLTFADLFLIHQASQWYSGTIVPIEQSIIKALSSIPMAILINVAYMIMASIAMMFCFFPVIFVIVFFLFIFQALVIEGKGFGSFGRSIEIVKPSFGNFTVIPFLLSFVFQIIDTIPFYFLQSQLVNAATPDIFENMKPIEIFELVSKSPYTFYAIFIVILFISLQSNLKTILYTIAFEEGRKDRNSDKDAITDSNKFA